MKGPINRAFFIDRQKKMNQSKYYPVIVVGGGHAGTEAALLQQGWAWIHY